MAKQKLQRIALLDQLRGLCLLLMVAYHAAYDWVYLLGREFWLFEHPIMNFLQPFFAGVFILISGVCCNFSRDNLRRGVQAVGFGLLLSFITGFIGQGQMVVFGILHLLGSSMIIYALCKTHLQKLPTVGGVVGFGLLFALCYPLPFGGFGLPPYILHLPQQWYVHPLGFLIGLPSPNFRSSDYFPLLPWGLLFLCGSFVGRWLMRSDLPRWVVAQHLPPLDWMGRHSLWIYLLHQPLLYGLVLLINILGL